VAGVSWKPTAAEIADRYADARDRVLTIAADIDDTTAEAVVPATPRWKVRELVAHLVGCPIDLAAHRFDGAGGDEWTQAQVDARQGRSIASMLEEWRTAGDTIDAEIRAGNVPAPVTLDILTHEQDLRGALGIESTPDPLALRFLADGFGGRAVREADGADLPRLRLSDGNGDWTVGAAGGTEAVASEFEWTRALAGRRSRAQVTGYDWSADPAPYLDLLCPFGPLGDVDVYD
jgi:uncharacterized protein (TIGR03083 family)